ncbi:glycoside hydrolase family 99-like domain-containing protein [Microbacterium sp. B35-30]|uniref:glycoside hydrolase family 99-like domain-containing protein n=1 Tax=Microbacterium sp. B35-30 TaxID=1962642 RepID=UPI0013D024DE|nr:glycoside hydrolase family 99-like domain-containing protein [Microbacterium sp. B35-30]KAF2419639.1 hypothetical protein B2K11_04140 [Microbacterium sp. B35-30]
MRTIAFYLPQFHQIPENDQWWGEGFTEWTNVRRAQPQFDGHDHPRQAGALGEYDLSNHDYLRAQAELARDNGVDGFCLYMYWFNGHRLLERPLNGWRDDGSLLPYCISWANESWTRRWDGKERDVLMPQDYAPGFIDGLVADLLPHFRAPHYMCQGGEPILLVHRAELIPDPIEFTRALRQRVRDAGFQGIHLVASETSPGLRPQSVGFDAVAEFPPVGANTLASAHIAPLPGIRRDFRGRLMSYERLSRRFLSRKPVPFVRYAGVAPGWDNTARRGTAATIYVGSTPGLYREWLARARASEQAARAERGLVFINAWNEWAEGAYLEPDRSNGDEYLKATRIEGSPELIMSNRRGVSRAALWSVPHLRSLALTAAASGLAAKRRVQNWAR